MIPRPMKPCQFSEWVERYPVYLQPKLDGVRSMATSTWTFSGSKGQRLANTELAYAINSWPFAEGLDGELMLDGFGQGKPHDFHKLSGIVRSRNGPIEQVCFVAFDVWNQPLPFWQRMEYLEKRFHEGRSVSSLIKFILLPGELVHDRQRLELVLATYASMGFEGGILRHPDGPYKPGRSTGREGYLVKWKPFVTAQARIVGFEPLRRNLNEQESDAFGRTKRSSSRSGKVEDDLLGALICETAGFEQFRIGTGFDEALRAGIWAKRDHFLGQRVQFKYLKVGSEARPRHPVFLAVSSVEDSR